MYGLIAVFVMAALVVWFEARHKKKSLCAMNALHEVRRQSEALNNQAPRMMRVRKRIA